MYRIVGDRGELFFIYYQFFLVIKKCMFINFLCTFILGWKEKTTTGQILPAPDHFGLQKIYAKENIKIPLMK